MKKWETPEIIDLNIEFTEKTEKHCPVCGKNKWHTPECPFGNIIS